VLIISRVRTNKCKTRCIGLFGTLFGGCPWSLNHVKLGFCLCAPVTKTTAAGEPSVPFTGVVLTFAC
jgi:hypothetical protein